MATQVQGVQQSIYVGIFGGPRVGKSSFIREAFTQGTSRLNLAPTTTVQFMKPLVVDGKRVVLVDTPSYYNPAVKYLDSADILKRQANFFVRFHENGHRLSAIIFIHPKMTRPNTPWLIKHSLYNWLIVCQLVGDKFFPNLIFASTSWSLPPTSDQISRDAQAAAQEPFRPYIRRVNWATGPSSHGALDIIRMTLDRPPRQIAIQRELTDRRLLLGETTAGRFILKNLEHFEDELLLDMNHQQVERIRRIRDKLRGQPPQPYTVIRTPSPRSTISNSVQFNSQKASPIPLSDSRRKIQAMGEGILGGAALSVLAYEAFPPNTEGYQYVRDDHYIDDGEYVEDDQYVDNNQYFSDDPFSDNASDGDEVSEDNYTHFWDNAYPDGNLGLHFDNDLAASDDEPYDIPAFSTYLPGEVDSPGEPYTDDDAYVGGCQEAYPVEIGYDQYVDNGSETNEGQAGEHDWTGDWDGDQALYNNESDSGNMIGNYTSYIADSDDDHVYGQSAYKDQGSREGQDVYADQSSYDDSSSHEDPGAYEAPEYRAQELNWDQEYEYVSPYADTNEVYDDDVYDDDLDDGYQSYDVDDDVYDVYGDDF